MSRPLLLLGARTNSGVWTPCQPWAYQTVSISFLELRIPRL